MSNNYDSGRREGLHTKKKRRGKGLAIFLVILGILAGLALFFGSVFMKYYRLTNYVSDEEVRRDAALRFASQGEVQLMSMDLTDTAGGVTDAYGTESDEEDEEGSSKAVLGDIYNLLLVGVDRRDDSWYGNSDSMILMSINRKEEKIHMISFMRDLYANIPGHGEMKLNAACAYGGCPLLVDTLKSNYDVDVDNYVSVDFGGMIRIVDAVGGVQLEVTDAEAELANSYIRAMADQMGESPELHYFNGGGTYLCDGYQATAYSRIRYVGNSDYQRTERQRTVLSYILNSVRGKNLKEMTKLANKILPALTHNIDASTMLLLLPQLPAIANYEIEEDRVPYDGLYTSRGEILVPDMDETIRRIHETIYGET